MHKRNLLKIIILITMTADHIGALFFPEFTWLRIIGRLAFPIIAFQAAQGYKYTSNLKNFFLRLIIFACISQIPYHIAFGSKLNPIFTIVLGLLAITLWHKNVLCKVLALVICVSGAALPVSYGAYGIFMVFIFDAFQHLSYIRQILLFVALNYVFYVNSLESGLPVQVFSVLALPLIYFVPEDKIKLHIPEIFRKRPFYYIYYPAHILILYLLS